VIEKGTQGFASMDKDKQREIARKGGKTASAKGTAHRWTREEASEAGSKGGTASAISRAAKRRAVGDQSA
jgi:general stress protein YciG